MTKFLWPAVKTIVYDDIVDRDPYWSDAEQSRMRVKNFSEYGLGGRLQAPVPDGIAFRDTSTFNGLSSVLMRKGKDEMSCCAQSLAQSLEQALSDGWRLAPKEAQRGIHESYALALRIQERFTKNHKPMKERNVLDMFLDLKKDPGEAEGLSNAEIIANAAFARLMRNQSKAMGVDEPDWLGAVIDRLESEIPKRKLDGLKAELEASEREEKRLMSQEKKLKLAKKNSEELRAKLASLEG